MMTSDLLTDAFRRIDEAATAVLDGLNGDALNQRPGGSGNSIAWLLWHVGRVQDAQVAPLAGVEQRWTADGFCTRFGFDLAESDTGYGHSSAQVDAVQVDSGALLRDYLRAASAQSREYVRGLSDADLDDVVDTSWDPPVTRGVRLVSILDDCMQHVGQAAYVKGLPLRRV